MEGVYSGSLPPHIILMLYIHTVDPQTFQTNEQPTVGGETRINNSLWANVDLLQSD